MVAEGKLAVAGIVEEQHGERAALFMQWKQMDWPVMVDSLNLLGVRAVPLTYLIDEHGIIRAVNPKGDALEKFLATDFQATEIEAPKFVAGDKGTALAIAAMHAPKVDPAKLNAAIAEKHEGPAGQFRLGVLHRKRHDSPARQPGDFAKAVAAWGAALDANPAQYIWRRRIQQYGPLLDKPYPFYDWIHDAQQAIRDRGDEPVRLNANLSGTERASPSVSLEAREQFADPDPDGKLPRDTSGLIEVDFTVVASTDKKSPGYRIHLRLSPNAEHLAHWNNESGPQLLRIGEKLEHEFLPPRPAVATSNEPREIDFEFRDLAEGTVQASAYYYVCEGVDGTCQYLRHDFEIELRR